MHQNLGLLSSQVLTYLWATSNFEIQNCDSKVQVISSTFHNTCVKLLMFWVTWLVEKPNLNFLLIHSNFRCKKVKIVSFISNVTYVKFSNYWLYISKIELFTHSKDRDWNVKKNYKKSNKYIKSEIVQKYMFKVELFDKHCFTQALPPSISMLVFTAV